MLIYLFALALCQNPILEQEPDTEAESLEDQQTEEILKTLSDAELSDEDGEAMRLELSRTRRLEVGEALERQLKDLITDLEDKFRESRSELRDDARDDARSKKKRRSRRERGEDRKDQYERESKLEDTYRDEVKALRELLNVVMRLQSTARGFAAVTVCAKHGQDRRLATTYRSAIRGFEHAFHSPQKMKLVLEDAPNTLSESQFLSDFQFMIKQCFEQHAQALKSFSETKTTGLASELLAQSDGLYKLINTSLKAWIGDRTLTHLRWDSTWYSAQRRSTNIHVQAVATAWARAEMAGGVSDDHVKLACRWLDEYSPEAELIREVESPYRDGAVTLRKRQKAQGTAEAQ